jgi:8-oxo-dGTP pyrophosphatase MutT (NUDIX family)
MPKEKSCGAIVFKTAKNQRFLGHRKSDECERVKRVHSHATGFSSEQKDDIKYLLLHYEAGHWDFPKGNQEKNEKEEQTVAREIKEETSIEDIEFIDGFRETINYFYKRGNETIFKEVAFFLAQSATEKVKLSFEHIGYAWMSYENAYKRLTFNSAKELLKKADSFLHKG